MNVTWQDFLKETKELSWQEALLETHMEAQRTSGNKPPLSSWQDFLRQTSGTGTVSSSPSPPDSPKDEALLGSGGRLSPVQAASGSSPPASGTSPPVLTPIVSADPMPRSASGPLVLGSSPPAAAGRTPQLKVSGTKEKGLVCKIAAQSTMEELAVAHLPPNASDLQQLICKKNPALRLVQPAVFPQLSNLTVLWIEKAALSELPVELFTLTKLEHLFLGHNQIRDIPPELGRLVNLKKLNVQHNQIVDLPATIRHLTQLRSLYAHYNNLLRLPVGLCELEQLREITVQYNPLITPPAFVCTKGVDDIKKWLAFINQVANQSPQRSKINFTRTMSFTTSDDSNGILRKDGVHVSTRNPWFVETKPHIFFVLDSATASTSGRREYMEDRHVNTQLQVRQQADVDAFYYGIYDGHCLHGDTAVTLASGVSMKIKDLARLPEVLSLGDNKTFVPVRPSAFMRRGRRKCIELLFSDGRKLVCTPEHRIRTTDGWCEAGALAKGQQVVLGVEGPLYDPNEDLAAHLEDFELELPGVHTLHMATAAAVDRAHAFARLLGLLYTEDGSALSIRGGGSLVLGHRIDADQAAKDYALVLGKTCKVTEPNEHSNNYSIALPAPFLRALRNHPAIRLPLGTRKYALPALVTDPACPKSFVREFLGGLFGGDGAAPTPQPHTWDGVAFHMSKAQESQQLDSLTAYVTLIATLLKDRFEIDSKLRRAGDVTGSHPDSKPKEGERAVQIRLFIPNDQTIAFQERVGFRHDSLQSQVKKSKRDVRYGVHRNLEGFPTWTATFVGAQPVDEAMEVYDISVPYTENFLANGITVHNCGDNTAEYLKENMHKILERQPDFHPDTIEQALTRTYADAESGWMVIAKAQTPYTPSGATALSLVMLQNTLTVAWCGDSRAVLCQGTKAVRLSRDHKPKLPDEEKRIKDLGGIVDVSDEGVYRVMGVLAVSRALGDIDLKEPVPYVSPVPEVKSMVLTPRDQFIIAASDGVWDVFGDQSAVDMVRRHSTAQEAADAIIGHVNARKAKDNATCTVIYVHWAVRFPEDR